MLRNKDFIMDIINFSTYIVKYWELFNKIKKV